MAGKKKVAQSIFDLIDSVGLHGSRDLTQVPNVEQIPLERYNPPRGRPSSLDKLLTPETARRMEEYAKRGEAVGGREWYNTDPLREAFTEELGQDLGTQRFNRLMDITAATSPRSRVDGNIRRASYLQTEDLAGRPIADLKNADFPPGYGHLAHETQNYMLRDLAGGNSFQAMNRPKVSSFAENLKGNQAPMTIDTHNFAAITGNIKNKKSPADTQYRYLEEFQAEIADKMNMTPAQFQASVWMGADTGVADPRPFMQVFDEVIARTASRDKKTKSEALRDFINGKSPLYSLAGGTVLGAGTVVAPSDAMASPMDRYTDPTMRTQVPARPQMMQQPSSMFMARMAEGMDTANEKLRKLDPTGGLLAPELPAEFFRKSSYDDSPSLRDGLLAAMGML